MVSCTYPAPFHAHTHFLATVCDILILDAAPQAPTSLCAIALLQDLHHLCLVDWVNALQGERDKEAPRFVLLCSFPLVIYCVITVLGPILSFGHCPLMAKTLQHKQNGAKCHPAVSSPCQGSKLSKPHQTITVMGDKVLLPQSQQLFFLHLCEGFCCSSVSVYSSCFII